MLPFLREHFGNPSSSHPYGAGRARRRREARRQVATLLGARPRDRLHERGLEANNAVLLGVARACARGPAPRDVGDRAPGRLEPCAVLAPRPTG